MTPDRSGRCLKKSVIHKEITEKGMSGEEECNLLHRQRSGEVGGRGAIEAARDFWRLRQAGGGPCILTC
jgi:hypothetical protein